MVKERVLVRAGCGESRSDREGEKGGGSLHTIKFLEDTLNGARAAAAAHLDVEFVVVF